MKKSLPLILSIFSVILFTVSATTLCCGGFMNPFPLKVKTVEAFQHDLKPTIIAAHNELLTAEGFMVYKNSYQVDTYSRRGGTICSFQSHTFFFVELSTGHIRDTYNRHLLPLGFKLSKKRWISNGVELANLLQANGECHAVVTSAIRLGEQTTMSYYTQETPTDGSTSNLPQLIDQPGHIPSWFDPDLPPASQK